MATITINGISFDPATKPEEMSASGPASTDVSQSNYILVQTREPLSKERSGRLVGAGAQVLEYVPENSYICRCKPTALVAVRALPFVGWADTYPINFKINPGLKLPGDSLQEGWSPGQAPIQQGPGAGRASMTVDVVLHQGVDANRIADQVAAAVGLDREEVSCGSRKIRATVDTGRLDALASIDEVRHVEPVFPRRLHDQT